MTFITETFELLTKSCAEFNLIFIFSVQTTCSLEKVNFKVLIVVSIEPYSGFNKSFRIHCCKYPHIVWIFGSDPLLSFVNKATWLLRIWEYEITVYYIWLPFYLELCLSSHNYTHTHHFTALWILSGTSRVSQHQKGKTSYRKVKPIWIYWSKR